MPKRREHYVPGIVFASPQSVYALSTALVLAFAVTSCTGDAQSPTSPGDSTPVIVAFGDSLTSGPGLTPAETYPALLQQRILAEGFRYRVVNAGVTGDTTSEALRRFDEALVPGTRLVIVAIGINDGLRGVPVATVERNITAMVDRARARKIDVLLCAMEAPPIGGLNYTIEFHRAFTRVADRYDIALVPFFLLRIAGNPDLNLEDRFHPNAAGHRVIAETLWPYLRPMLLSPATGGVL